jgi:hypothetical protein
MAIGVYNVCLGWVLGRAAWHATACQPPNVPRVVDTLMRVHGWQLMGDGVFNAGQRDLLRRGKRPSNARKET